MEKTRKMSKSLYLTRQDIKRIQSVLDKFSSVTKFDLTESGSSGIGTVLNMSFEYDINGTPGTFTVEISGVDNW